MAYRGASIVHYYKGYVIYRPEGTTWWNVYKADENGEVDWLHHEGYGRTMKECKNTIDAWAEIGFC